MKKLFFALLLSSLTLSGFSQSISKQPTSIQTDYLTKSKHQKTAALILLGGGGTLVLTGIIIPNGDVIRQGSFWDEHKNDNLKLTMVLGGLVSMLGSIPVFIVAHHTKRKAGSLSFKMEPTRLIQHTSFVSQPIPSLTLKLNL